MADLFLDILNASFAASWVVLAVLLARLALKKAPRWMVCSLWALVALRLLMPLMPEAPFSLIPSSEIIPPQSLFDAAPQIDSGVGFIDNAVNPVYTESLRPMPGASVNPLQVWMAVFANLWGLGMGIMAAWALVSCLCVRQQIRERIRLDGNVYLCDRVASPFIFGLFRPIICLPSGLDEALRSHVIAHERAHLSRRDHWWKPIGFLLLTVNWFNPLMWLGYLLLCRDIEMACDERVARGLTAEQKKSYSFALLSCSIRQRRVTVCPLAFGEVGVKMRVKSVLHYKKPAFWVILVTAVLILVLSVGLLTNPVRKVSELRYNGHLYILEHQDVSFLPVQENTIGSLRSVLHNTTEHPDEEFQATNLDSSLAGCPLFLEENRLYLQKYDGSCLAFRLRSCEEELLRLLRSDAWYSLGLHRGHLESSELLQDSASDSLTKLLRDVAKQQMSAAPSSEWEQYAPDCDIWLEAAPHDSSDPLFWFFRTEQYGWVCMSRSDEFGDSAWCFNGSALDSFLLPYTSELDTLTPCFPTEFHPWLFFETLEQNDTRLRIAIPSGDFGSSPDLWHWEPMEDGGVLGLRCRPSGRKDWMEIIYSPEAEADPGSAHQSKSLSFPNGINGILRYTEDPNRWEILQIDTLQGQLAARKNGNNDWTDQEHQMATAILSTISVSKNGSSLLPSPNRLSISLMVQNATSQGLDLVCIQQKGQEDWAEIVTGADWAIQKWDGSAWSSSMPRDIAWPAVLQLVNQNGSTTWYIDIDAVCGRLAPGQYRIGKTFYGHPHPDDIKSTTEAYEQRCWAEFILE